jgi:hypothetical protein
VEKSLSKSEESGCLDPDDSFPGYRGSGESAIGYPGGCDDLGENSGPQKIRLTVAALRRGIVIYQSRKWNYQSHW